MLHAKVPQSRILVYNYESAWHAHVPKTRLQPCEEGRIHAFHRGDSDRPLVFAGYSLGGNVTAHVGAEVLLYANFDIKRLPAQPSEARHVCLLFIRLKTNSSLIRLPRPIRL
jgi:hypothetical protein